MLISNSRLFVVFVFVVLVSADENVKLIVVGVLDAAIPLLLVVSYNGWCRAISSFFLLFIAQGCLHLMIIEVLVELADFLEFESLLAEWAGVVRS